MKLRPTTNNDFDLSPIPSFHQQKLYLGIPGALYAAGGTGHRDFSQGIGITSVKTGLTYRRHENERALDLQRRKYAGIIADLRDRKTIIRLLPNCNEWFLCPLPDPSNDPVAAGLLAQIPHAEFHNGVIYFRVPVGIDLTRLEKRYQKLLAPRNLNTYLSTPKGARHLTAFGLPSTARLFSDYLDSGVPRRSLASELFRIRVRKELPVMLLALLRAIQIEQARVTLS